MDSQRGFLFISLNTRNKASCCVEFVRYEKIERDVQQAKSELSTLLLATNFLRGCLQPEKKLTKVLITYEGMSSVGPKRPGNIFATPASV